MIHDWKMELYWRLPVFLQEAVLSAFARRLDTLYYGPEFERWCEHFRVAKDWSKAESRSWQQRELVRILEIAATRVPYYREAWKGLDWRSVRSAEDLPALPRLDKQDIRQNESRFLAEGTDPAGSASRRPAAARARRCTSTGRRRCCLDGGRSPKS